MQVALTTSHLIESNRVTESKPVRMEQMAAMQPDDCLPQLTQTVECANDPK